MIEFNAKTEYLEQYKGETIVIKCGGETLEDEQALDNVLDQLLYLAHHGIKTVLVHGGGGQIKARAAERGIEEIKQKGVRVTCKDTLGVVEEVMDELNTTLAARMREKMQSSSWPLDITVNGHGAHEFINAEQVHDLGLVGEPSDLNGEFVTGKLEEGLVVVHPVCKAANGQRLNVNADSVAGAIGRGIGAKRVVFCTSMPGVLDASGELISKLSPKKIDALIEDGTITDGMEKKIRECEALLGHVEGVAIVGSGQKNSILHELLGEGSGTLIQSEDTQESKAQPAANIQISTA